MPKEKAAFTLIGLEIDRKSGLPLYQQLYEKLRRAILERRLTPGERLPPTRELAEHLKLSRSTVLLAFEHLAAEGYVEGKTGAGTFVSEKIPERLLYARREAALAEGSEWRPAQLSRRGRAVMDLPLAGRPLSSLQGIDRRGRVLYMGTFSKVLFPGLRLGYLVVPPSLTEVFTAAKAFCDRHCPVLEQAVLARFMQEGHFGRHLRRMRLLYEERQQTLINTARQELRGLLDISPSDTGLHLVAYLPKGSSDIETSERLQQAGIIANPLSGYTFSFHSGPGLVLGYAPYRPEEIQAAVRRMKKCLID